ncbi:MAG: 4a-hydroxytetrahydrobiopterin dehydratase [Candidatus Dormibacteraceae bacterium]
MATPIAQRHCVACEPGTPPLPRDEVNRLLEEVPDWDVEEAAGHLRLTRTVKFKGFMSGVELIGRIAPIAEAECHHPDLLLSYGSLTIQLWTHAAAGLTENDFILAARLDQAISQSLN